MEWAKAHFFVGLDRFATQCGKRLRPKVEEIAQRVGESEGIEIVEVEVLGGGNSRLVRHLHRQARRASRTPIAS